METEIVVASIGAIGSVISATIAAIAAALIGKRFIDQETLRKKLSIAQEDIAFLLEVERRYGEHLKVHEDQTLKNTIRREVREITGLRWSGENTAGRVSFRDGQ